uniref:Uncharacterized protein n=1 Tax=Panstrongylus lignarius TaxID=156445 RepID=A0A224Y2V6_9HEMI
MLLIHLLIHVYIMLLLLLVHMRRIHGHLLLLRCWIHWSLLCWLLRLLLRAHLLMMMTWSHTWRRLAKIWRTRRWRWWFITQNTS